MSPHDPLINLNESQAALALDSELLSPAAPVKQGEKTTYPFVNLVRFVSTIGIVFLHNGMPMGGKDFYFVLHHINHVQYYFGLKQVFKFATICYFMIAGFLLSDKTIGTNSFEYYKRRLKVIALPYLLAITLFVAIAVITDTKNYHDFLWRNLFETVKYTVLYTPFWYIPNYFICLLVIVCFSKYLDSPYFGGVLFLVTLGYTYFSVYSVNYTSSHTTALFGFVFYMWLGVFFKRKDLVGKIKKKNAVMIGGILMFVFLLCNAETYYLFNYTHTHDSLNTLRLSNQLYSVMVFVFLVRYCSKAPKFWIFNPRSETYGIYLYHAFFIIFIIPMLETWIGNRYHFSFFSYNGSQVIGITLLNFAICYLATTALVKVLLHFKLAYLPSL